ncbi:twin-arginine translocation signal domain-containing protein [Gemmatimonas sp.]|jgi:intracellular sulfur oxidation DsrE/DsrF family protein|uniref:twin-arginine translocation signal domain-containing protein n=1 Tax=Gemmatimonas sp. TaxID=1962908 RepID=UPI0022BD9083|nr:twin-arginine translocation signal domain-containing protein [Gemmatimonas sp.]MCZ8205488.1 twin-arginine translocation signal domain-containing protein [Gemmatimonas sp.]
MMANTPRRDFLGRLAAFGATIGVLPSQALNAAPAPAADEASAATVEDPWMKRVAGTQRVVFHSHMPTDGLALRWAQTFLDTQKTVYGIREQDCTVMVGLNGRSIGWFFNDAMWAKYPSVGEVMGMPGTRNPMTESVAILARRNVLLLACGNSIRASGGRFLPPEQRTDRERTTMFAEEARKSLLPGVEVVPAMIVTLQQAQDRGLRYVYAGG